jgi:transcriptional regulator with XRE-family HTH domain
MPESSIRKPQTPERLSASLDRTWRECLGRELRRRRLARHLTQAELGEPLTKAFVSAVEHGHTVPSLPALRLMVGRLDTSLAGFLAAVEREAAGSARIRVDRQLTGAYDLPHE